MEKVLDVYKRPYDKANPVICMDESPKQLIAEAHRSIEMKPGQPAKVDYDYIRHGMCNVLWRMSLERKTIRRCKGAKTKLTGQPL